MAWVGLWYVFVIFHDIHDQNSDIEVKEHQFYTGSEYAMSSIEYQEAGHFHLSFRCNVIDVGSNMPVALAFYLWFAAVSLNLKYISLLI